MTKKLIALIDTKGKNEKQISESLFEAIKQNKLQDNEYERREQMILDAFDYVLSRKNNGSNTSTT